MRREDVEGLTVAASAMGTDMIQRCEGAAADARVSVPVSDFRKIAGMLQQVAAAMRESHGLLDGDGFRFWLPLPQIEAQRRELSELRDRSTDLAAKLRLDTFRF